MAFCDGFPFSFFSRDWQLGLFSGYLNPLFKQNKGMYVFRDKIRQGILSIFATLSKGFTPAQPPCVLLSRYHITMWSVA